MNALASIILPVFGLIAIGYLAGWTSLLPQRSVDGLTAYVFNLAVPLLAFRTISAGDFPDVSPWAYWGAYFAGVAGTWAAIGLAARLVLGAAPLRSGMAGCAAAYSNAMLLGLPLVLVAFREAGHVPLILLLSVHLPVMMAASVTVGESTGRGGADMRRIAVDVMRAIATNPIIIGIVAALAWKATGLDFPGVAAKLVGWIADTAVPCALVAMGLTLRQYGIVGDMKLTALILAGKLVLHPLLVFATAWAFGLPPVWAGVAVLFAAAPSGVTSYVTAVRYNEAIGAVSSAVLIGTALSLFTITGVLAIVAVP